MKLTEKIFTAKNEIKETKVAKQGRNTFSKYDYFTPAQIESLVANVCKNNRILTKFDLVRDSLGVFGRLTIFDLDSEEALSFDMATAIPDIKATNIAQQLGGCVTYTERYLKMSAFGITDSNLDFDNDSQKKTNKSQPTDLLEHYHITQIETLLQGSSIDEKEKEKIEKGMLKYTKEIAERCIEYLKDSQVNRIEAGHNYNTSDIANQVKSKLADERA